MSTTPADTSKDKKPSVAKETRDRVLGTRITPESIAEAEKKKADEAQRVADEAAAAEKKKADALKEEEAKAKKKERKAPPELPPAPPLKEAAQGGKELEDAVRKILPEVTAAKKPAINLTPDMERDIELARFAERTGGEKYTGFENKVVGFFVAKDELLAAKAKELGGQHTQEFREFLEGDELKSWLDHNRPNFAGNKRKFEEDMVAERARIDAQRALQPKIQELERRTREVEHAPTIKKLTEAAVEKWILMNPDDDKDPALEGFRTDSMKFGAEHPDEARIIAEEAAQTLEMFQTAYRVDLGIEEVDHKNPAQARVSEFMRRGEADLARKFPNGVQMTDGKILINSETYAKHKLQNDPRYRTFTVADVAGAIALEGNRKIRERLKQRRDGVAKSIYAKQPAVAQPAQGDAEPPKLPPPASPEATTSRAPGTAKKADVKKTLAGRYA